MFDWDKDGKIDHNDDYIYHEILSTKKNEGKPSSFPNSGGHSYTSVSYNRKSVHSQSNEKRQSRVTFKSLLTQLSVVLLALLLVLMLMKVIYY